MDEYDLSELVERTGVTARTIRYYIQFGLLRAPGYGSSTTYTREHLLRLHLIRFLQRQHLPLGEIKTRIEALTENEMEQILRGVPSPADTSVLTKIPGPSSAEDYVNSVLGKSAPGSVPAAAPQAKPAPRVAPPLSRSQWERISLTPNIEIHAQRPLSRDEQRFLQQLLDEAQRILGKTF